MSRPTRESIKSAQTAGLKKLLASVTENPFWTAKLGGLLPILAGKTGDDDLVSEFRRRVPFCTKAELCDDQSANPPYGANLSFPLSTYTRFSQTSGTSGIPVRWLDTPNSWAWMTRNWARVFQESGVGQGDAVLFAFSFGPFLGFWCAFDAAQSLGCLCVPGGGMSTAARLQLMLDLPITAVCCTPTYALRLGESARESAVDLSACRVKSLLVAGEPGGSIPEVRAKIESLWPRTRVWDHHGMTEVGPVTYECPANTGLLHIMEEEFIAEVVDPNTLEPIEVGDAGELILTSLGRLGSPVLRYRTGDLVQPRGAITCTCGSEELALEGGILGRCDDMVVVRGVNLYPAAVDAVICRIKSVAEYQVLISIRESMAEAVIRIEAHPEASVDRLTSQVEEEFRKAFNLRVEIEIADAGSLPRFEMKAKRWQVTSDR